MKLYHGSTEMVISPQVLVSKRTLDFGYGFYTTTSEQQAKEWAVRRGKSVNVSRCYINEYRLNQEIWDDLRHLHFEKANEEWLDFVMANRTDPLFTHEYDVVSGPVADDCVYAAFALFEGGFLNRQQLIDELQTYKLVNQYLFHTSRSLDALYYWNSKLINI